MLPLNKSEKWPNITNDTVFCLNLYISTGKCDFLWASLLILFPIRTPKSTMSHLMLMEYHCVPEHYSQFFDNRVRWSSTGNNLGMTNYRSFNDTTSVSNRQVALCSGLHSHILDWSTNQFLLLWLLRQVGSVGETPHYVVKEQGMMLNNQVFIF